MKKAFTLFILTLLTIPAVLGQQNFERQTHIEINERADFYEVNDRYQIISDTLFYGTSGFLINAEYDTYEKDGVEYMVVTYPAWDDGVQSTRVGESILESEFEISDIERTGVRHTIRDINGKTLMIEKSTFDKLSKITLFDVRMNVAKNYKITTGLLTIPFKIRPYQDSLNFKMTTDVTIGPYIGITKRISKRSNNYLTIPATLGLSFINISSGNTINQNPNSDIDVIPGFTWSSGLIIQFNKFSIGYVFGQDYASGVGNDWVYQGKMWHSFAIGYSFLKGDE